MKLTDVSELEDWLAGDAVPFDVDVARIVGSLDGSAADHLARLVGATGFAPTDAELLWADQQAFLKQLADSPAPAAEASVRLTSLRDRPAELRRKPYGTVLVCLPSNAPVPLTAILGVCSQITGNRCIFARPRGVAPVVDALISDLGDLPNLALWTESPRQILSSHLGAIDHVYFMGASSAYVDVATKCATAGASFHFEGQGNGFVVVGESAGPDLETIARTLLVAKSFCNGAMCSAPNGVLVHESLLSTMTALLSELGPEFPIVEPLGHYLGGHETWDRIAAAAELTGEGDWRVQRHPVFARTADIGDALSDEFFAPGAWLGSFSDFGEALARVTASRYRLQISYFGHDVVEVDRVLSERFARYCVNMNPVDQDPVLPWGNFGLSGQSRVQTFLEKFTEPVLVEGEV